MNGRRITWLVAVILVFIPVCVVAYQLTVDFVGFAAEPVIAPVGPLVIIDHFHTEVYLEALFLGTCLAVSLRRYLVWGVGVALVPATPVFLNSLAYLTAGEPGFSARSFSQDAALWLVEGVSAGLVACAIWEAFARISPVRAVKKVRPT